MKILAYGVHLLTAIGAALGLWSIILIYEGLYKDAMWVLALSVLIDSIDGALARKARTEIKVPKIDGALMDNIIDFITWTIAPLFWAYATLAIPIWVLSICAIGSIFAFSNKEAKTSDWFFLGFPSYWNIVVLYLFLLEIPHPFTSVILLVFALGTLAPIKFIYPTRTPFLKSFTIFFGTLFFLQLILLLYLFERSPETLIYSSFLFPVYYFALSFYLNLKKI